MNQRLSEDRVQKFVGDPCWPEDQVSCPEVMIDCDQVNSVSSD